MHLRLSIGVILLVVMVLLSGCNGSRETEEVAYIIAFGIDKADQEGKIKVTYQIARPQAEGGKGGEGKDILVVTNTAVTLAESLNLLNSMIALVPSMSQCKVLVVGEGIARQGLGDIWGPLFRYREFRGSMYVLIARSTAKEVLEANKPVFNISNSKYFEMMLASGRDTGYYLRTSLHQFYIRLKSKSIQSYAPLVAVNPQSGQGESSTKPVPGGKIEGYIAGDVPRHGGNPIEFSGTAIFSGDKMVGRLSTTETRILAMLLGEYPHGFLSVQDPLAPQLFVSVNLRLGSTPKIKVVLVEGRPVITINILLEGEFTNLPSGINYEEESYLKLYEAQVNNVVQQEMVNMIRHTQELNADVAGLAYYVRPSFSTYPEYENYNWLEQYSQAEVHVSINTKIRRTGLMLRSFPVSPGM